MDHLDTPLYSQNQIEAKSKADQSKSEEKQYQKQSQKQGNAKINQAIALRGSKVAPKRSQDLGKL